jgi:hypothetical protein
MPAQRVAYAHRGAASPTRSPLASWTAPPGGVSGRGRIADVGAALGEVDQCLRPAPVAAVKLAKERSADLID